MTRLADNTYNYLIKMNAKTDHTALDSGDEHVIAKDREEAEDQGSASEEDAQVPAVKRGKYKKKGSYGGRPVMTKE